VSPKSPKPANAERRLAALRIELPLPPTPIGAYVESVQTCNMLYLSGILPVIGHEPKFVGRLGREYNVEQGREAARIAALNVLSAARNHLGSLDKVTRVVRLVAYIATEGDFYARSRRWLTLRRSCCAMSLEKTSCRSGWFLALRAFHSACRSCWRSFSKVET
jgi:enamine deaminase RidA (YjgF/YER057c/UK114 family)